MSLPRNPRKSKHELLTYGGGRSSHALLNSTSLRSPTEDELFFCVNEANHTFEGANNSLKPQQPSLLNLPRASVDLRKEYIRFCRLYSSEPLEIVSAPLERASFGRDPSFVDLKGRGLRGVDCIALGKILASDAPIGHLNLSDSILLPQGFQALLEGLNTNSRLHTLELRGNNIQGAMICLLSRLIKVNQHLKRLLLEWNCLGTSKDAFAVFCESLGENGGLEVVDLRNNQLNAEAGIELATALKKNKTIRSLDLRWNSIGVGGAKAIWDSLRSNFTLHKIQLCGNFIPDEIVTYIEQCLEHSSEREKMMEEYASRTTLLTRQLQKSEKVFRHEIDSMMNLFDVEENELKTSLESANKLAKDLDSKLNLEIGKAQELASQVEVLRSSLKGTVDKENLLRKTLEMKEEHLTHLESFFKEEVDNLKCDHGRQLKLCQDDLIARQKEVASLRNKICRLEGDLEGKIQDCNLLQDSVGKLKKSYSELSLNFKERIKSEGEKWSSMKQEMDSSEHYEIKQLEIELKHMQSTMMEHIKHVEKAKREADRKVHELELGLIASKATAEDSLTKLRSTLKEEQAEIVEAYKTQLAILKGDKHKLESDVDVLSGQLLKSESDKVNLVRHNDELRKQLERFEQGNAKKEAEKEVGRLKDFVKTLEGDKDDLEKQNKGFKDKICLLEKEIKEKDAIICASLTRARNEVKELSELMASGKI